MKLNEIGPAKLYDVVFEAMCAFGKRTVSHRFSQLWAKHLEAVGEMSILEMP